MIIKISRRGIAYLFLYFLISLAFPISFCHAETTIIQVNYRDASDVLPGVKSMLSPSGEAVVDEQTNSLVVTDSIGSIQKIRTLLTELDVQGKMVRVRVRFEELRSAKERSLSAEGRVSGESWEITRGRRRGEGVTVNLRDENTKRQSSSESFINVNSGNSAYIVVGKDIPYLERWLILSRRYAQLMETVVFRRVETGMEVRPVVTGKVARVDIIPKISYETKEGEEGTIRFATAQTAVTVPLGQWVSIGGNQGEEHEVLRALLECGRGVQSSELSILMKVEAN